MEFKGTKGKWLVGNADMQDSNSNELVIYPETPIPFKDGYRVIACISTMDSADSEDYANAQLIAHAPEMLDFINRISGEMLRNDFVLSEEWYEQAQELIESATQI